MNEAMETGEAELGLPVGGEREREIRRFGVLGESRREKTEEQTGP